MGTRMKLAPVYFTLAQVRFNPILALDNYVPDLQNKLRLQGFPNVQKAMLATFNFNISNPNEAQSPQVPVSQVARYIFSDMDKTEGFILDQGSLAFQTTNYDVFESFSATFLTGLKIVHEAVKLSYTDRIGVRYLDAIYPKTDEQLSKYLTESVLGIYKKIDGELVHSFQETRIKNGKITVIARTVIQDGGIGFPPDLLPTTGLLVSERFRNLRGPHAILDTDGAHEQRDPFDLRQVEARLSIVHSAVIEAFNATITDHAIRAWT